MQEELILIDKLEDQLIDNPDANTQQEIHDSSLDETFQRKLNERAEQLAQGDSADGTEAGGSSINPLFLTNKTSLDYHYRDYGSLDDELNDWFSPTDFKTLNLSQISDIYTLKASKFVNEDKEVDHVAYLEACISKFDDTDSVASVLYFVCGEFRECTNQAEQTRRIRDNVKVLYNLDILDSLVPSIMNAIKELMLDKQKAVPKNYFSWLTIFYFILNTVMQCNDIPEFLKLIDKLRNFDILSTIVVFLEHWKINPNPTYRIRYLILILWKLILVEFGDSEDIKRCDNFLIQHHNIHNKTDPASNKLTCSPLDYFTFREDLMDKYPLFKATAEPKGLDDFKQFKKALNETSSSVSPSSSSSSIHEDYNFFMALNLQSSSLSNYIAKPRPNKSHTIQSQLPAQTLHISTPVPSPSSTPSDYMSGGEKIRKLYQVNQSLPFIYPLEHQEIEVPYAIKEANDILENSVYDSYSNKRLWSERQKFMIQERGYLNEYGEDSKENSEEFEYKESVLLLQYPQKKREIKSITRVEQFYAKNLESLSTLMAVLIETIKVNKIEHNLSIIENELNRSGNNGNDSNMLRFGPHRKAQIEELLNQQLELIRAKEITAKASSAIIYLLVRWFKVNHILKSYYLTCILFDQQICNTIIDHLSSSFNNPNLQELVKEKQGANYERMLFQNRLMNPQISKWGFFNNCLQIKEDSKIVLVNRKKLTDFDKDPNQINGILINKFNENFCFTTCNLVNVLNKVIIKNYTQRILTLNELKPSEVFKMIILNYDNKHLTMPLLKILKKLIPYQGRKWKSVNMDLISLIYLNCKLSVRDNWLSGKDLENDFNNSFDQEISLRGLLQFYNMRKYPDKMAKLGYEVSPDFCSFPLDEDFEYL